MNNCEIVDNVACGVSFQYCRTHKVEPKDCPGNQSPTTSPNDDMIIAFQHAIAAATADKLMNAKREFKVGDKVRHLLTSKYPDYKDYGFPVGAVGIVMDAAIKASVEVRTPTGSIVFLEDNCLEHV